MSLKSVDIQKTLSLSSNDEQKLSKNFTWTSLLGIAFSLTNSWLGVTSALVVGLYSGGPLLIIYGLIIGMFFTFMCGWSLAEFSSILPSSSGTSFWVLKMLEKRDVELDGEYIGGDCILTSNVRTTEPYDDDDDDDEERRLETFCATKEVRLNSSFQKSIALIVGLINYFGSIFTTASVFSSLALSILGVHSLLHTQYQLAHWHVFLIYEILNALFVVVNSWSSILPFISQFGLYMSVLTYFFSFVVTIVCRSNYSSIEWPKTSEIFVDFKNTTGWSSAPMAFIVGLINPLWAFAGIDSATHMVDDLGYKASRKLVPLAILTTITIGFLTSFTYAIGMFFCITDVEKVTNSILPILEIYYQATGNRNLSVLLQCCCILTGLTCASASVTWQSRILWSVGRDFSQLVNGRRMAQRILLFFGTVNLSTKSPLNAHLFSQFCVAIIGCIFMGSSTAFNAIITACITLLLLSYAIPCVILLCVGKRSFYRRIKTEMASRNISDASFPVQSKIGYVPTILTVAWAVFCLIFLSFPYTLPVTAQNMNYVSVVYAAVFMIIGAILCV